MRIAVGIRIHIQKPAVAYLGVCGIFAKGVEVDILRGAVEDHGLLLHLRIEFPEIEVDKGIRIGVVGIDIVVQRQVELVGVSIVYQVVVAK